MRERLTAGAACLVTIRGRKVKGTVTDQQPKGYMVKLDGEAEPRHFGELKVKAERPAPKKHQRTGPTVGLRHVDRDTVEQTDERPMPMLILSCSRCGEHPGTERLPWAPSAWPSHCPACLHLAIAEGPPPELPPMRFSAAAQPRAVVKPSPPEKSSVWEEVCRRGPCINCGKPPRSTISHEGSGVPGEIKGVSQKHRDTLGTSKCWEPCHRIYTRTGCLPDPVLSQAAGEIVLRSRAESLAIIHAGQEAWLLRALMRLPREWRIEALSVGVARVPEEVLRAALLGEREDDGPMTGATT